MKRIALLLFALLCSTAALTAQTPNYHALSGQPERVAAAILGTDVFAIYAPGLDFVKVSSLVTYFNSNLGFIPINSVISGSTWQGNVISATYGGTGWNSGSSTGMVTVSSGTWSATSTPSVTTLSVGHVLGHSTAPAKAAGTGAGTSPTITLDANATNLSGKLTVLTGSTPAGSAATIVTLTFDAVNDAAFANAPHIILTPNSATAAALGTTTQVWADSTTTTLILKSGSSGLTAATTYVWFYAVMQ